MDEFQFIESLDALLANEDLEESTTAAAEFANTSISPVQGQGILSGPIAATSAADTTWLSGNDNFAMPLHSNQGYTTTYPQYTTTFVNPQQQQQQQPQTALGPLVPSASPAAPTIQRPNAATAAVSVAHSGVESVCSANSRGSSNASSSRRKSGGKSSNSTIGSKGKPGSRKRSRGATSMMAVSDSEDESSKRRHDRNLREQRRSQKITNQIDQLREVLAAASVRFKPDKYSTLVSVVEYVKELQRRSTMLDMEHKKLLDTITQTNEMVNKPHLGNAGAAASSAADGTGTSGSKPDAAVSGGNGVASGGQGDIYNDDELVFVRNVDYRCIFERCGMPLAVASIDGRLMDCNQEFVKLTGYRREELLPNEPKQQQSSEIGTDESFSPNSIFPDGPTSSNSNAVAKADTGSTTRSNNTTVRNFSLFNLLSRENMEQVFVSLSEMLKQPPKEENGTNMISNADYWSGNVRLSRNTHIEMRINVSLVRSPQGRAKFFDCSLTPVAPTPPVAPAPPMR